MASDVNKLIIAIETKGTTESKKEIEALRKQVKELADKTKTNTDQQQKQSQSFTSLKSLLPSVASGVYLVQQAYSVLSSAVGVVTEAYEEQYSAEVKLNTLLTSTGNAIGYTYDEVYKMAQAWQDLTGINDAVILEASAITATFTQISKEVFPDTIEAALNMSTIFNQDLKQSIVQLGTALNSPITGLGRLRRIGISFSESQKEMITGLSEAGDTLGAQTLILEELELELGNVARAMGDTSLGAIKKYKTSWENLFEEVGEAATNWLAILAESTIGGVEFWTGVLSGLNAISTFRFWSNADISKDMQVAQLDMDTLEDSLEAVNTKLENIGNVGTGIDMVNEFTQAWTALKSGMTLEELEESFKKEKKQIEDMIVLRQAFNKTLEDSYEDKGEDSTTDSAGVDSYLTKLQQAIDKKKETNAINAVDLNSQKELIKYRNIENALIDEATALELPRSLIMEYIIQLREQEKILLTGMREEEQTKAEAEAKSLLIITEEQKAYQEKLTLGKALAEAVSKGLITDEEAVQALKDYNSTLTDTSDLMQEITASSLGDLLSMQLSNIFSGTEEIINWEDTFTSAIDSVYSSLGSLADSTISTSLESIGAALYDSSSAASDWESAMESMIASTLTAVGPQLLLAGASRLAVSGGADPMGWALLAAGGASSIYGGYLSAYLDGSSDSSSDSSTEYVYTGVDSTTSVDSDEYESDTISKGVTVNVNNNAGVDVTTSSTTSADGKQILDVVLASVESKYNVSTRTVKVGTK